MKHSRLLDSTMCQGTLKTLSNSTSCQLRIHHVADNKQMDTQLPTATQMYTASARANPILDIPAKLPWLRCLKIAIVGTCAESCQRALMKYGPSGHSTRDIGNRVRYPRFDGFLFTVKPCSLSRYLAADHSGDSWWWDALTTSVKPEG